jgi:hypothetical protein
MVLAIFDQAAELDSVNRPTRKGITASETID